MTRIATFAAKVWAEGSKSLNQHDIGEATPENNPVACLCPHPVGTVTVLHSGNGGCGWRKQAERRAWVSEAHWLRQSFDK